MKTTHDTDISALRAYLRSLQVGASGWMMLDRDSLSIHLGITRVQLARLLKKAESRLSIEVDGDRVRFVERVKISKTSRKPNISRILCVVAEIVGEIDRKSSPKASG